MAQKQPLYTLLLTAMGERAQQVRSSSQATRELMEFGEMLKNASDINENHHTHIAFRLRTISLILLPTGDTRVARKYLDELVKEFS